MAQMVSSNSSTIIKKTSLCLSAFCYCNKYLIPNYKKKGLFCFVLWCWGLNRGSWTHAKWVLCYWATRFWLIVLEISVHNWLALCFGSVARQHIIAEHGTASSSFHGRKARERQRKKLGSHSALQGIPSVITRPHLLTFPPPPRAPSWRHRLFRDILDLNYGNIKGSFLMLGNYSTWMASLEDHDSLIFHNKKCIFSFLKTKRKSYAQEKIYILAVFVHVFVIIFKSEFKIKQQYIS
jgi:hypothetical protein